MHVERQTRGDLFMVVGASSLNLALGGLSTLPRWMGVEVAGMAGQIGGIDRSRSSLHPTVRSALHPWNTGALDSGNGRIEAESSSWTAPECTPIDAAFQAVRGVEYPQQSARLCATRTTAACGVNIPHPPRATFRRPSARSSFRSRCAPKRSSHRKAASGCSRFCAILT